VSGDELVVTFGSAALALFLWGAYGVGLPGLVRLGPVAHPGRSAWLVPIAAAAVIAAVLRNLAASDVRDAPTYLFQYFAMGMVWVYATGFFGTFLGLSIRDDVVERANRAAFWACGGLYVGAALTYAGANVGEGPGWWCVVLSGGVATLAFLAAAFVLLKLGDLHEAVSVERSLPAGTLTGLVLVALGLVAGRGAAGDWEGFDRLLDDFAAHAWPMAPLALVGGLVGRGLGRLRVEQAQAIAVFGGLLLVSASWWWIAAHLPPP
jgi:hypothetical protein